MTMETALRSRIKAVADEVHWSVRPQNTPLPCVVLTVVADNRSQNMGGLDTFRDTRVQIDCYGATYKAAADLREAVIDAVLPEATVSGVTFLRAFVNTVLDRGDQTEAGFIHREMIDLSLWHNG